MTETIETYCIECDETVVPNFVERRESLVIKGEPIEYVAKIATCPKCGAEIADSRIEQQSMEVAYAAYCAKHGLVSKAEVRELRMCLGLSLREFSRFLGFGEQTATKYDKGSIPDLLHSNTMRMASTPKGAEMLLALNGGNITQQSAAQVRNYIQRLSEGDKMGLLWDGLLSSDIQQPCAANGFRPYEWIRVSAMVIRLAGKCHNFCKTKLQKASYFCDGLTFELTGRSLTGMTYVHATYGPIMPDYDMRISRMICDGSIRYELYEWGKVIVPNKLIPDVFTDEELSIIDKVAEFVNTFPSATELSDYSHELDAWKRTSNGELISYVRDSNEIQDAIERRIASKSIVR